QDSLNAVAGGNLLERSTQDVLTIIENKSKVRNSQIKSIASQLKACDTNSSSEIAKLTYAVNEQTSVMTTAMTAMLKQLQATPPPASVKAVEETCVTSEGAHPYYQCLAAGGNTFLEFRDNIQGYVSAAAVNYNQGNPGYRPQGNFHLNELEKIKRINDVNMKSMQTQIDMVKNELRNEMKTSIQTSLSNRTNEIKNMMASLLQMNTASTSSSGTLPSSTVANSKSDLKAITTRSRVSYDGPLIPPPVVENKPEATKDTVPNPHASIPYPSRRNDERNREKAKDQINKFYQIFKDMSFEISFTDALILMPKFTSTLKALIGNKEKLCEMALTPLNEHCSAVLLKKLPEKLGDPGKFLILCDFAGMAECLALADLGASINLMPYSAWKRLSLLELTPTCMTLELVDRSISRPVGVAEDVYVKVANYNDMTAKRIDFIDMACEEYSQEVLGFSDTVSSGNPATFYDSIIFGTSPTLTLFGESNDKLPVIIAKDLSVEEKAALITVIKQEVIKLLDAGLIYPISDSPWVSLVHCVPKKGGFTVVEIEENELIPTHLVTGWRVCIDYHKLNEATQKDHLPLPFMDQMLERLAGNQYYCFLDGFLVTFKFPSIPRIKKRPHSPVHMGRSLIVACLLGYAMLPERFRGEKSHFMVKEGIALGHKISKKGIEVDKVKYDVISTLPHPTTVKGIRSFLGHAGFYHRFIKDFSKIASPMTRLLEKDTLFVFSQECVDALQTLKRMLTKAPILIASDWDMPFELICDASDFAIGAVLG
nr:reverse transcriptase domain-containing protein [Tanacetum cinerariifolium]